MICCIFSRFVSDRLTMQNEIRTARRLDLIDRIAIGVSGVCLLHCIATMLVVALLASAGGLLLDPMIHELGLGLAILLGLYAFSRGFAVHGRKMPLLLGLAGISAMGYALSLTHGVSGEVLFTVIGILLVVSGHELNRRAFSRLSRC